MAPSQVTAQLLRMLLSPIVITPLSDTAATWGESISRKYRAGPAEMVSRDEDEQSTEVWVEELENTNHATFVRRSG